MAGRGRIATTVMLIATALLLTGGTAAGRDRVHHCHFWSWTGPSSWTAVCSKQGITVSSPDDRRGIDWGFSGMLCYPGATLRQSASGFMGARRRALRKNGVRFARVGPIRLAGSNYFRQVNTISAGRGRLKIKGTLTLDYSLVDPYGGYCHQSSRVMSVPAGDYRSGMRQLKRIYHSMAYSGPGA